MEEMSAAHGRLQSRRPASALVLALIASVALLASIGHSPFMFKVRSVTRDLDAAASEPVLLYCRGRTCFYYVAMDLLHPERFGPPARYVEAILFDVWPAGEQATGGNWSLHWPKLIWHEIAGPGESLGALGEAEAFRAALTDGGGVARGRAHVFVLSPASSYARSSGVRGFAGMAVRWPDDRAGTAAPQLFDHALRDAFRQLDREGVSAVGIPRMDAVVTPAQGATVADGWSALLQLADREASGAGLRTVLYGGWAVSAEGRELNAAAFQSAWSAWQQRLEEPSRTPVHEELRLMLLVWIAAVLRWYRAASQITWTRMLALAVFGGGVAVSIASAAAMAATRLAVTPVGLTVGAALCAIAAGWSIEWISRFDARSILGKRNEDQRS